MKSPILIKTLKLSDRYEDLGLLGRGGMGEVRRVFDQMLGRAVAMKLINTEQVPEKVVARFIEEAQISARLQHPNILPVHDLGRLPDGRIYFTMKIAVGESLVAHIKSLHDLRTADPTPKTSSPDMSSSGKQRERERYSLKRLLSALKQVGDAVAYAHSCGVLHRDLKPLNIMLGEHGSVQLLDWGIAQKLVHYYDEWVGEVIGQFDLTLTPADELLNDLKPTPADSDMDSDQETSGEGLSTTIYAVDQEDSLVKSVVVSLDETFTHQDSTAHDTTEIKRVYSSGEIPTHQAHPLGEFKRFTISSEELISLHSTSHTSHTSQTPKGEIAGTLHYMSPEQLSGDHERIGQRSDVFGLGVLLYEVLTGSTPFKIPKSKETSSLSLRDKLDLSISLRAEPLTWPPHHVIPEELKRLCESALAYKLEERLQSAEDFSGALVNYLDGVGRREQALERVREAERLSLRAGKVRSLAAEKAREGEILEDQLKATDPEELKRPVWEISDEAQRLNLEADGLDAQAQRALTEALLFDHELPEAHTRLTKRAISAHQRAEAQGSQSDAVILENHIKQHLKYAELETQQRALDYLSDEAPVTIYIDAPSAPSVRVTAQRYELRGRRLQLSVDRESWGEAPLIQRYAQLGRYLLTFEADGYEPLIYPIIVERLTGWSGAPPDDMTAQAIPMLPRGRLPEGFRYVPQGWFYTGGDPLVSNSVEQKRRLWVDGFVCAVKHVTHAEYLVFLNDLIQRGERDRAYHLRPRLRDEEGEGLYRFTEAGVSLEESEFAALNWPANYNDYEGALAYCEWRSHRDNLPHRLPTDMEWEKIARGVDARCFPWGDYFDPAFTHMRLSLPSPQPSSPEAWSADQGPWGHLALAGSMRDWTSTLFRDPFPYEEGGRVLAPSLEERADLVESRVVRGGSWKTQDGNCRVAFRFVATPKYRDDDGGFRLAFPASALLDGEG